MHDLFSGMTAASGPLWAAIAALVALAALTALMLTMLRGERSRGETAAQIARLADLAERLTASQAELAGRLQQTQIGIDQRLDGLARRLGDGLLQQTERTGETLRVLHERLALIDSAQQTIAELSSQVVGLHNILGNKQARGAWGEVQLEALVRSMLPPNAFQFQATLSNNCRVDCLLRLPDPPGSMAIDAKFPLESFQALRDARDEPARVRASRAFAQDVLQHVRDIASKYILPGETSDSALMFLPSEAVYAELHANFRAAVENSYRRRVWIVSPSTLWATLNTMRAVLRDVRLREQAGVIQAGLRAIADDVARLDQRAGNLQRHFDQAAEDVRQIRITSDKLTTRAGRLDLAEIAAANAGNGADEVLSSPS